MDFPFVHRLNGALPFRSAALELEPKLELFSFSSAESLGSKELSTSYSE